ncbi:hypothetical protein ACET3Z_000644 [Daucus carota]
MSSMLVTWAFLLVLLLCSTFVDASSRREVITARHGAVATDDGRCSLIGRNVLREGGHAIDATVAAALCLGVVSPASSGIGGGAFMVFRSAHGKAQAFDMRESAPIQASQNMYDGNADLKSSGALSVAVPGELAGLHKAWKKYGRLPWKRLVRPAERLARRGFTISAYLHMQMVQTESGIMKDKGLSSVLTSNNSLLQPGDMCYNKKLAKTLRAIAKYGIKPFYNGSVGLDLVQDLREIGGILTMKDLQQYQVKMRKPISAETMGLKVLGMPPPSSGGASMVLILNILAQYGAQGLAGSLGIHRNIEALKHAFAVRMNLGDPDFVNVKNVVADMLSPKFAKELKKTIYDNMTFSPSHYGGKWNQINEHGTSHLSIVDAERNAVSMTTTVNSYFGAQIMSPSTGIVLNNEMDDFSIPFKTTGGARPPAPANFIVPGKRPLSSMTPTIVLKGKRLIGVVGASGGSMIIAGTTEVFLNHFARKLDPLSSVMAPRVYHQLIPNVVLYENWTTVINDHFEVPAETRASLQKKGHVLEGLPGGTICQFVAIEEERHSKLGQVVAVSDPRKGGIPAGF